jgi:diguanylate cyclase
MRTNPSDATRRPFRQLLQRLRDLLPRGNRLDDASWQQRHRGILLLLVLMAAAVPAVAIRQGYPLLHGLWDAAPAAALAMAAFSTRASRRWSSALATFGLWTATAGYIHLTGGLIEAHFLFFVLLGVVTLYQDWLPYLLAVAFTAIHHGVMGYIDPGSVFNHPAAIHDPVKWALVHAGFVVTASVANLVAWKANEELTVRDSLTRLPNRRLLSERIDAALGSGTTAVLFLDLCGFKTVNDSLGHEAGDAVLRQVADRLRYAVRAGDSVARFGGDEFAVVLNGATDAIAREVAERLIAVLAEPIRVSGMDLRVGASIGIAISGCDGDTTSALLRNADAAMYEAKRAGAGTGSYARFTSALKEATATRLALEADLGGAIERDELRLFYQPVLRLRDGETVGAEALLRWQHPTRGLVGPGEFIPLAEDTGLIVPIGVWILDEACRAAAAWPATTDGQPRKVSVNISARQLRDGSLVGTVAGALTRSGLKASALCLEITESLIMLDVDHSAAVLGALKDLGVQLSIDDFGTGYSSLARLKSFPLDYLKVDKSFVDGLAADSDDEAIVTSIIDLAHGMGMVVVAEGVEGEHQLAVLRRLRCEAGQGWLWSRAVPEAEFLAWLDALQPAIAAPALPAPAAHPRVRSEGCPSRVLVVDDDPIQRELVRILLGASGHEVITVDEPGRFLDVLGRTQPDLVLMDLRMPGRSGLDLVQDMAGAGHSTTVVAVSAHSEWLTRSVSGAEGFAGAIAKPIDPQAFAGQVQAYLTGVTG